MTIEYPLSDPHLLYRSQASLEGVNRIECFFGDTVRDGPVQPFRDVILEYWNKNRAPLGECRLGISKSIQIVAPTVLHLKQSVNGSLYSAALFTSSASKAKELDSLGWEGRQMNGTITWWFGLDVMEIVHSPDSH
jgi:hypothetical protein